jgi:transcriptional regulator
MYTPKHFEVTAPETLAAFIDAHSFGALITAPHGRPSASHVPFLLDRARNVLHCHLARANPQWQELADAAEVLVIFTGPHGYVSPTWYADPGVPTWNYTAVHVYGAARVLDDPGHTARHVEALAAKYERGSPAPWVPDYDPRRLGGIVGIEIGIRSIEGKFKLSQNRSAADRAGVIAKLRANGRDDETALAGLMESLP